MRRLNNDVVVMKVGRGNLENPTMSDNAGPLDRDPQPVTVFANFGGFKPNAIVDCRFEVSEASCAAAGF